MQGCQRNSSSIPLPPGELLGASVDMGHRLRSERRLPEIPLQECEITQIVIAGGGVAGLSAARELNKAGIAEFQLFELENDIGGTSRFGSTHVSAKGDSYSISYPWGAHYLPAPTRENPALVELCEEMGCIDHFDKEGQPVYAEEQLCWSPQERIFYRGTWYEGLYLNEGANENDLQEWNRFHKQIAAWVNWRDGEGNRAFTLHNETKFHRCVGDRSGQTLYVGMDGQAQLSVESVTMVG